VLSSSLDRAIVEGHRLDHRAAHAGQLRAHQVVLVLAVLRSVVCPHPELLLIRVHLGERRVLLLLRESIERSENRERAVEVLFHDGGKPHRILVFLSGAKALVGELWLAEIVEHHALREVQAKQRCPVVLETRDHRRFVEALADQPQLLCRRISEAAHELFPDFYIIQRILLLELQR
jgi:hypothetical protein